MGVVFVYKAFSNCSTSDHNFSQLCQYLRLFIYFKFLSFSCEVKLHILCDLTAGPTSRGIYLREASACQHCTEVRLLIDFLDANCMI
jgi:hypothetical protein